MNPPRRNTNSHSSDITTLNRNSECCSVHIVYTVLYIQSRFISSRLLTGRSQTTSLALICQIARVSTIPNIFDFGIPNVSFQFVASQVSRVCSTPVPPIKQAPSPSPVFCFLSSSSLITSSQPPTPHHHYQRTITTAYDSANNTTAA